MVHFLWIITLAAGILCMLYVILIASYCYGWSRTEFCGEQTPVDVKIAVIIAARNEEQNIGHCLDSIIAQSYPVHLYEVIVADDSSEDATGSVIAGYSREHSNIRMIELRGSGLVGKKAAISQAISLTDAELIITTDADCIAEKNWLSSIASCYKQSKAVMIAGPVAFQEENTLFKKMQGLELLSLMGSTAGSLYYDKAILCNGANLAYTKKAFEEVNGFKDIDGIATGDDVLLMYKMAKSYKRGIRFLKNSDAIVSTQPMPDLPSFIQQRKRWASKNFKTFNTETKRVSLLVFSVNFLLLFLGALSGIGSIKSAVCLPFFQICLILTGIKCIIDFLLLFLAASFFDKTKHLYLFLPGQLFYMLYVVVISFLGRIGNYEWKGRKVN
jgi:cellulose synthase/poly-beta-1,6-N-acetylglucosamine synthase-like glycosyltransferase